jgi:hypothetical protein
MFNYLARKALIRMLRDTRLDFPKRLDALMDLVKLPYHPETVAAIRDVAVHDRHEALAHDACHSLGSINDARAKIALLDLAIETAAQGYTRNYRKFDYIMRGLNAGSVLVTIAGEDGQRRLVTLGETILRWPGDTSDERKVIETQFSDVIHCLSLWGTKAADARAKQLQDLRQSLRTARLGEYLQTALTAREFWEAEAAVAEIAQLATPEATAILRKIRSAPERTLEDAFEVQNEDVTEGYSPVGITRNRSSRDLGDKLKGDAKRCWELAGYPSA